MIHCIATDELCCTLKDKTIGNRIDDTTGGNSGVEPRLGVMYTEMVVRRGYSLPRYVDLVSTNAAKIMGLYPRKGVLAPGSDADITILDPNRRGKIRAADLHETDYTPWEGHDIFAWPTITILRGKVMVERGEYFGRTSDGHPRLKTEHAAPQRPGDLKSQAWRFGPGAEGRHLELRAAARLVGSVSLVTVAAETRCYLFICKKGKARVAADQANLLAHCVCRPLRTDAMKTTNNRCGRLAHCFQGLCKAGRPRTGLILLIAMAVSATCTTASAQSIIGSPGAGFQTWKAANLNNNGAPYWDAFTKNKLGNKTSRNIGFCLTNSGDCVGINSALSAPGAIPFWGMTYNSAADTGGGRDTLVYFKSDNKHLRATLQLQLATTATEINEFGWFETNSKGTTLGPIHRLFQGSGLPAGPSPVGKEVNFKPTKYFGFYYKDVSEGGCAVYTIASFTTSACSNHVFAVFATKPGSQNRVFEIAGLDPPGCGDGDCNLTLVRIQRHGTDIAQISKATDRDYFPRSRKRSHQTQLATTRHSD